MTDNEYLAKKLDEQSLKEGSAELKDLDSRATEVEEILEKAFPDSNPAIRIGGSRAKGTMIKEYYDLDLTCYFPHDDDDASGTLKDIYEQTEKALQNDYQIERKASALRLRGKTGDLTGLDFHVDVVPGRFIDGDDGDVFIYQHAAEKDRLRTNLEKHIEHVKDSGVVDAIKLMKLWSRRRALGVKTFVLELLVIDLLAKRKSASLSAQLTHVWQKFRDESTSLSVKDPTNENNDLSKILNDVVKAQLSTAAGATLSLIEASGWESVFGRLEDSDDAGGKQQKLQAAVAAVSRPTKPWAE